MVPTPVRVKPPPAESGETISLPEGAAAQTALTRFADIHRATPMLGRGFVRFDLRVPDKMVVRVGGEPGAVAKPRPEPKPPTGTTPGASAPAARQPGVIQQQAKPMQTAQFAPQQQEVVI